MSISSALIVIGVIGVLVELARTAPGLAVIIAVIALPALIRGLYCNNSRGAANSGGLSVVESVFRSLAIAAGAVVAVFCGVVIAFFTACFVMISGVSVLPWYLSGTNSTLIVWAIGFSVGAVIAAKLLTSIWRRNGFRS